jgi:hypothetical protein
MSDRMTVTAIPPSTIRPSRVSLATESSRPELLLFPRESIVGVFRGFSEGGLEFHADIVLPYRNEFQSTPMHGQFLLVQLEHENEAVLGRITSMRSDGRLASGSGEDYGIRAMRDNRAVPDDLREQYLKYRVDIRVLGVVRVTERELIFAASHRRLPHVGSHVAFLSPEVLKEIAGHNVAGADLGFFALGEFVYAKGDRRLVLEPWIQPVDPTVVVKFDISQLVAKRTFIFARAGFGKSNLTKLLFTNLYSGASPTVTKRGGREVPVGTVIFDPEGEYFWPDDKGRPGLCDVPALENQLVVFSRRAGPSPFYQSFVASDIKLDIRRLRPSDVISIALSPEKQDQQNVRKLKALRTETWERLVDEIERLGNQTDLNKIKDWLHLDPGSDAEAVAARSNMTAVVHMLHDRSSQMLDILLSALRAGKLCVVDVSQLRGGPSLVLSGLILNKIFETNQDEFTKAEPKTIPTIAVIEEAQTVLGSGHGGGEGPHVDWVKEGRKYDLGSVMVTQQPGSIPTEILSQGDNWFLFHLLSAADLQAVKKANAHFSDNLLSALLNEPIHGHGVFWSSAGGRPYPVPIRALLFEAEYTLRDPTYSESAVATFASKLRGQFKAAFEHAAATAAVAATPALAAADTRDEVSETPVEAGEHAAEERVDVYETFRSQAIAQLRADDVLLTKLRSEDGVLWMAVQGALRDALPQGMADRDDVAYQLTPRALNEVLGEGTWERIRRPSKRDIARQVTWVRARP